MMSLEDLVGKTFGPPNLANEDHIINNDNDNEYEFTDEELDKIKIGSDEIMFCISVMLKEAKNEERTIKQLFYGVTSCYTHIPTTHGVQAHSGAGKTHVINNVVNKFSNEDIIRVAGMSIKAMYHQQGIRVVKSTDSGIYEPLETKIADIEKKIEDLEVEIEKTGKTRQQRDGKEELTISKKIEIKKLEQEKRDLIKSSKKLIDLEGKVILFMDTPKHELLTEIATILSHDSYETEYKFTDRIGNSGLEARTNIIRGYPAVVLAQAIDNSDKQRFPEVNRRIIPIGVTTSKKKVQDAVELQAAKYGATEEEYESEIVSNSDIQQAREYLKILKYKLLKLSRPYKQKMILSNSNSTVIQNSGTYIPFRKAIANGLPQDKTLDMTISDRFFTYLILIPKVHADSRPKLVYGNGKVVPFATYEDLAETMHLMEFGSSGLRPELQQWYTDVFLPLYQRRKEDLERLTDDEKAGRLLYEKHAGMTSAELVKQHAEFSEGGIGALNSEQIRHQYLNPLLNQGFIDKVSSEVDHRENLYFPLIDPSRDNEKNKDLRIFEGDTQFSNRLRMRISKKEAFPTKEVLIFQIKHSIECVLAKGNLVQIIDSNGQVINAEELVDKYYNNPEEYFSRDYSELDNKENEYGVAIGIPRLDGTYSDTLASSFYYNPNPLYEKNIVQNVITKTYLQNANFSNNYGQ